MRMPQHPDQQDPAAPAGGSRSQSHAATSMQLQLARRQNHSDTRLATVNSLVWMAVCTQGPNSNGSQIVAIGRRFQVKASP